MAYELTQREYCSLKRRLTVAINSKDASKISAECRKAFAVFEAKGYPDDWSRWQRAMDDANLASRLPSW